MSKGGFMMKNEEFSGLKNISIKDKKVYIVDQHQYTLPLWAYESIIRGEEYVLVSIDYHPDTNPPFWQKSHYQAIMKDDKNVEQLTEAYSQKRLMGIDSKNILSIIELPKDLNNDEHINTAMALGYLKDYHMINCMDAHEYEKGTHYLISAEHFSSLDDEMFRSIGFKLPEDKFILDIDLDYFSSKKSFAIDSDCYIKELIQKSEFITIARSKKYFEYLKKPQEDFTLETCEKLCLDMIEKHLS